MDKCLEFPKTNRMKVTGPLFKWFGSKWLSSKTLPNPRYKSIIEPFAGSAGYSLRYADHQVTLCESDPHIYRLWQWLICEATEASIREIPIGVVEGTDIRTIGLNEGQELLLKSWQRTNNVGSCWTISKWGNLPGQFTSNTRSRVASEFAAIRHWKIFNDGMNLLRSYNGEATWMIDPPYMHNYQYKSNPLNYEELGALVRSKRGQIIVCEAICQKTGKVPTWLTFKYFGSRITSRRKAGNSHHSKELIYEQTD